MIKRQWMYFNPALLIGILICIDSSLAKESQELQMIRQELNREYDVNEWPNADENMATDVYVQMFINSFGSLNAANMDYSIDVFLRQMWDEDRFNFTKRNDWQRKSITIADEKTSNMIWKPDTFFNNVKDAEIHKVTMNNVLLRVERTGAILYSMRVTLKLSCIMEFKYFPFDDQKCGVQIASYANTDDVIKYKWVEKRPIDLPDNLEIAQFALLGFDTQEITQTFVTGNFSGLQVDFTLRRQYGFHILQTYIPTVLIISISWVSFWLDPNAVPGRVSLGVTTLLTLTTLASGVRSSLPPVSYVKAIDVWVGTCMIMVFGALLEFTVANWLANKKVTDPYHTYKIPGIFAGSEADQKHYAEEAAAKPPTYMPYARALDRFSRLFFPGSFLVFNIIYWPYYHMDHYQDHTNLLQDM